MLVLVLLFDAAVAGAGAVAGVGAPARAPSGTGALLSVFVRVGVDVGADCCHWC